jgi:hypothetical protein
MGNVVEARKQVYLPRKEMALAWVSILGLGLTISFAWSIY